MTEKNPDTANIPGADIAALSFEAALAELETIVRKLESGDVLLEESVALYARGDALRAHCAARLAAAQARIEQISLSADGAPNGTRPFASD
jgi:exodeoxyribonuclease VII small subunit